MTRPLAAKDTMAGPSRDRERSLDSTESPQEARTQPALKIRTADDYRRDDSDDEDDVEIEAAEMASRASTRANPAGRKHQHRTRPSASQLLKDMVPESPIAPWLADRQERLRSYLDPGDDAVLHAGGLRGALVRVKQFVKRNEGFLLIAFSQMFFAAINTCVKVLENRVAVPVWQVIWVRMSATWMGCYFYMRWRDIPDPLWGPKEVRLLLVARGIVGFWGLFGMYTSLQYLSLSDATVLAFLSPVLVGVLAALMLNERYTRLEALSAILSLGGVLLIAKPTFLFSVEHGKIEGPDGQPVTPEQRSLAIIVSLLGCCGAAGAYILIRAIGKRANALHSISYFAAWCVVVSSIYPIVTRSPPVLVLNWSFFALLLPIGIMGFLAQALLTLGLQREKAGRGTLAIYTNLLFALILEWLVFRALPDAWSAIGAVIIIGSAIWVALQKQASAPGVVDSAQMARRVSVGHEGKSEEGHLSYDGPRSPDEVLAAPTILPSGAGTGERAF